MKKTKILLLGAGGQLGYELALALRSVYGVNNVVAADIASPRGILKEGPFERVDVMRPKDILEAVRRHGITQIYHLVALLSANGEKHPHRAWTLNMNSLLSALQIAVEQKLEKVYWPSSIAVFGPDAPSHNTPQTTCKDPSTVYGITKLAGERWCAYYHEKYGLDVRSLRYPGLVSYRAAPGGGVTDYAIDLYLKASKRQSFSCFLAADTMLPMMYMDDAVRATLELMEAPADKVKVRASYNIAAMSFSPQELADSVVKKKPDFTITYAPDFRQAIAASWPRTIDDTAARKDWGWKPRVDLEKMTTEMLANLAMR